MSKSLMLVEEYEAILERLPNTGKVLEIGTFHGVTVSLWAMARPGVTFYSIDPLLWRRAGLKWYENRKPNMRLLTGTVDDLIELGVSTKFDAIIVDGDHSYNSCHRDLEVSSTLIKPDGLFAVHDFAKGTLRRTIARAVVRAVEDFCKSDDYGIDDIIGTTAFLKRMCHV